MDSMKRYEDISIKLEKIIEEFCLLNSGKSDEIKRRILAQARANELYPANRFIKVPEGDILEEIKRQYNSMPGEGVVGLEDPEEQRCGIDNYVLLAFMANRLEKEYRNQNKTDRTKPKTEKEKKIQKRRYELLGIKDEAMSGLLAAIFVLSRTSEKFSDYYLYGYRLDDSGLPSFVIDLPGFGQVSLHLGGKENGEVKKKSMVQRAKDNIQSILEKRVELGELSPEEFAKIEVSDDEILPEYRGKLFEYGAGFPMFELSPKLQAQMVQIKKDIGFPKKDGKFIEPDELERRDIVAMLNTCMRQGIMNAREMYYFAIKTGFPKRQLEYVLDYYGFINSKRIGESAMKQTTPEERSSAKKTLEREIQEEKSKAQKEEIGDE